jgi:hypothetical protein
MLRFYGDYASPVLIDRFEALDHVVEAAVELPGVRVLVDLAAQTHDPLVRWIEDSGVLNMADDTGFTLHYWHVMDSGRDSVDLLTRLLDRYGKQLNYVLVLNQLRGDDFGQLERSGQLERALALGAKVITIKHLHDAVVQKIDANNISFWAAKTDILGGDASLRLIDRQRLFMWLQHAFEELATASCWQWGLARKAVFISGNPPPALPPRQRQSLHANGQVWPWHPQRHRSRATDGAAAGLKPPP